ncbi:hypothetical protein [Sphingobacterium sp. SYP-B4668]|uniref:hypothetical protein n=1 Tax=Sphingobacterium sp. SYP-B4668 TaxID=2996035 RepID=UPI0022DE0158|nr:hypothetical protein [Sphingobacterium sp. SYP-B4668]
MKKISLKNLNLKEVEQLSREQLKNVLGGWTEGSSTDEGTDLPGDCTSDADCPSDKKCDTKLGKCYNNSTGYAVPCPTSDGKCVTRDGEDGTCDTVWPYGCR